MGEVTTLGLELKPWLSMGPNLEAMTASYMPYTNFGPYFEPYLDKGNKCRGSLLGMKGHVRAILRPYRGTLPRGAT